jgi:hypothetical protein
MKREKRLTKRERKANDPGFRPGPRGNNQHIHCVACGRHIDPAELASSPPSATWITCDHGSRFASCVGCMQEAQKRIDEHDRSGQPISAAQAWH